MGGGPFLAFTGNEYYGGRSGLTMWYINGASTGSPRWDAPQSTIKDFTAWHVWEYGVGIGYPSLNVTFDGLILRGDTQKPGQAGWYFGDYQTRNFVITRADISGFRTGIAIPSRNDHTMVIENSRLQNVWNLTVMSIGAPGGINSPLTWREVILRNVQFHRLVGAPREDQAQMDILMTYHLWGSNTNLILADTLKVYDFNGVAGDNFQVFYAEQHPDFVLPQTGEMGIGAPVAGLTNRQAFAQYTIALAGSIAPCFDTVSHPSVFGFTCPLNDVASPLATPSNLSVNTKDIP